MKAHTVKLVQKVEGQHVVSTTKIENIEAFMGVRGYTQTGVKGQYAAGAQRIEYREEMQGQPIYAELVGPMYDGEGVVRYEDAATNDDLSR